ncbi:MAG TPA: S8 family peptidase, partial [Pyrinomonadaceae bacterium]|nr:S8 family peptidase [Pyrinomonadaceae bacterium]
MKANKRSKATPALSLLTSVSLLLPMLCGFLSANVAQAAAKDDGSNKGPQNHFRQKLARDLRDKVQSGGQQETLKVILQLEGKISGPLNALLRSHGIKIKRQFSNFNSLALELPAEVVEALSNFPEVSFLSMDSEVRTLGGHVAHTTGADKVRTMSADGSLDGNGIGIAILDSGIYGAHTAFTDTQTGLSRIVVNQDFTGEGRTDDPYGHGTHVAAAAAGNGLVANGQYVGIAPRAKIINLRVLNSQGIGKVSNLLAALNWLVDNATVYNVRVANMSLGLPAVNSYRNDPICLAVRQLVNKGIVVTAAAGNNGKNSLGQKIYGEIHSPGIEPAAITVGAVDTKGTDNRADDSVATFSSRGPTRSFWTDDYGVRHYDNIVKPELCAPGNKTVFAESPNNFLLTQNPLLDANVSLNPTRKQMTLSGTSMAAPLVAGTAALMFEANPSLTPSLMKSLLMYTAQQLPNFNMFEQGAGELNIDGAVRLAKLVRTDLNSNTALGSPLLTGSAPTPQTTIPFATGSYTFVWSKGIVLANTHASGSALITQYQKVYGRGVLLGDGVLVGDGVLAGDATMFSSGVLLGDNILVSNGTTMNAGGV